MIFRQSLSRSIEWLEAKPDWTGLQAVGRVESTRIIGENTTTECRHFLSSLAARDQFAATVRPRWSIENQPHRVLDSAENLALIRRMALNVLHHNGPARESLRRGKLRAALNDGYRLRRLLGQPSPPTA